MNLSGLLTLILQSVTQPRAVAHWLMGLRLNRNELILAFFAGVSLNATAYGLSVVTTPGSQDLPGILSSPILFSGLQATVLAVSILALTWAGRLLGGRAEIRDVAILMIWLQVLRFVMQLALLLVLPISLSLGSMLSMISTAIGVWITVHFIDEAHGLGSLIKALGVLFVGVVGMALLLAVLLSFLGLNPAGNLEYV